MKVAGYFRESSDDTNKAPPISAQIDRFRQWAGQEGHEIVGEYADNGYSGGDWKRPKWQQAMNDAKRHVYVILWVWNQDRLARDTEQFLWFYRHLSTAKVKIYEDTGNGFIDMSDLGGRVKHQTLAQAGEIFRLVTSDKVKKAYQRKKAKGETWGRPEKNFDLELAKTLRTRGKGWREIAKEVSVGLARPVSYQTVRRKLLEVQA